MSSSDLNRIMALIQKLLVKADHSNTGPEEAAIFRAKAEQLMREYRVAEEDLIATTPDAAVPLHHRFWMGADTSGMRGAGQSKITFYVHWYQLLSAAAVHAGVRYTYSWGRNDETAEWGLWAEIVGYEGDLRLAEMLYTAARLVFSERIEPTVNRSLSDEENIYRLRSAGIVRRRVAIMLWGEEVGMTHAAAAKVASVYKVECAARGEEPALDGRGISAEQFRAAYAQQFCDTFASRLRAARDAADSIGGVLVLAGRTARVDEAFYEIFPGLRPVAVATRETAPARVGKPRPWSRAQQDRLDRYFSGASEAGRRAGQRAAETVDLTRQDAARRIGGASDA